MNERTRRGGSALFRDLSSAKHLGPPTLAGSASSLEQTEDAAIREALNVILGWAELLLQDVVDRTVCSRAVSAIERNAHVLGTLQLDGHLDAMPAVDAALRVCADLRASGRA